HQNGRTSGGTEFGQRCLSGPGHDQIGSGILLMKLIEEGTNIRFETCSRIRLLYFLKLGRAGLMDKPQLPFPVGEVFKRAADSIVDRLCPLTASKHEHRIRRLMRLLGNRLELGPNGVSRDNGAMTEVNRSAWIGNRSEVDPSRKHPI